MSSKRHAGTFFALFVVLLCAFPVSSQSNAQVVVHQSGSVSGAYDILLLSRQLAPEPGITESDLLALELSGQRAVTEMRDRIHALVQLDYIPTQTQKDALAGRGLLLLEYVPNYAWMAALPAHNPTQVLHLPGVRWVGQWSAEDKLHPNIRADAWGEWAVHPTEDLVMVILQLHADVDLERGTELAKLHGGIPLSPIDGIHGMTVWIPKANLLALASEEEVVWIEEGPPPLSPNNDGARDSMHINELSSAPYNLDGTGVRVFVFDGGAVRATHSTFNPGARVTVFDSTAAADHPTHVAGTVAGDGDGGRARGGGAGSYDCVRRLPAVGRHDAVLG